MYAEIIIDIKNKQVNKTFDYIIPSKLINILKPGFRVIVPFGNLKRTGYVIKIKEETEYKNNLKEIIDTLDVKPVLNEELIDIAKYIAINNFSFYSVVLDAMIPSALKIKYQRVAIPYDKSNLDDELKSLFGRKKEIVIDSLDDDNQKIIYKAVENNILYLDTKLKGKKDENIIKMVHLNLDNYYSRSKKKNELFNYLDEMGIDIELETLISDMGYKRPLINEMVEEKVISIYDKILEEDNSYKNNIVYNNDIVLNPDQQRVYESIDYNEYKTYLLHGITGSGKTEIYIRWINNLLNTDKTALMLVPEISLTPQITSILYSRFKNDIAILHSRLTVKQKYEEWKRIISGNVKIVVGARSAIFAPIKNLGIIIIDEAHENSYIQTNNPKYNAVEIATIRAKHYNIPLILGTATPKVSDYYYATNGIYELLELKNRANSKPLPKVELVDLREELANGNKSVLSIKLQEELKKCYRNNEQAILFINRRGYSKFVMCRSCGTVIKCPHCDIALTYHENINSLVCHHCGYITPNVIKCPSCNSDKIRYLGSGTEKIVSEVQTLIPEARILKVDLDSISKMSDYENYYKIFKNHEADIIVGTQMITKGLDFKDVTLVGVINADLSLHYPLYDSNEVTFNLLEQVSGRAGRSDKSGNVIIQSYNPNHFVINSVKNHNYESYYNYEINNREMTKMPPFSECIEIMIKSLDKDKANIEAYNIAEGLRRVAKDSLILGPVTAYPFKKCDIYRYIIQIQALEDKVLDKIKDLYPIYQANKDISLDIRRM